MPVAMVRHLLARKHKLKKCLCKNTCNSQVWSRCFQESSRSPPTLPVLCGGGNSRLKVYRVGQGFGSMTASLSGVLLQSRAQLLSHAPEQKNDSISKQSLGRLFWRFGHGDSVSEQDCVCSILDDVDLLFECDSFYVPEGIAKKETQRKLRRHRKPSLHRVRKKRHIGSKTFPAYIKEKETHWHRRAASPLQREATRQKMLMGIWRVTGSTQLQNLAVRSICVFNSTPSGNKLVGIRNRMGMEFASKFNGTLVVKSQSFKLVKGMLSATGLTNTQKDDLHAAAVLSPNVVQLMGLSNAGSGFGPVRRRRKKKEWARH
eukprot:1154930-Pelagomonas_calceolata.AAC.1